MFFSAGISFEPDRDIPPLNGKVILVTGGSNGLGKESILRLAKHNPATIWMGVRNLEKAQAAIQAIQKQVPDAPPLKPLQMNLVSFASISKAAATFRAQSARLDILILNAGIMIAPPGLTDDGYEIQFGTNHMGHALLTKLLMPALLTTASEPNSDVRLVILSSEAHNYAPTTGFLWDTLKTTGTSINALTRYGQSKLANILYAKELARRYPQIKVASVHPGIVNTNLGNESASQNLLIKAGLAIARGVVGVNVETGAKTQLWAATGQGVDSGEYYEPIAVAGRSSKIAKDQTIADELWEWTEKEIESYELQ
ncbi:hypothetical protein DER46DRAFT_690711 [Fusarium sp. MPI-SDFR-AT-0072]|nr:hypothetical protein DER46DRAFT_690711 [Fusarium sp. MPI-SDFR-AT-0072]